MKYKPGQLVMVNGFNKRYLFVQAKDNYYWVLNMVEGNCKMHHEYCEIIDKSKDIIIVN